MNRQTILASVHRQLRESLAETGEVRPLGEIVPRVAGEIRSRSTTPTAKIPGVIPIEKVAAFVDGHLEAAEADIICDAVMVDNSVLAEIIAAVRATQDSFDQLPPLSSSLSAQLLAMRATMAAEPASDDESVDFGLAEINVQPRIAPQEIDAQEIDGSRLRVAAILVAIAATIVVAIVLLGRQGNEVTDQNMVVDGDGNQDVDEDIEPDMIPNVGPDVRQPPNTDPLRRIAENESPATKREEPTPLDNMTPKPTLPESKLLPESDSAVASTQEERPDESAVATEKMPKLPPEINPLVDPDPARIPTAMPRMADVRWTEVSGLLVQRNEPFEDTGSRRGPTWRRIQEGSPSATPQTSTVALRTLPFSRASGELQTGGRIVISGDTGLQIARHGGETAAEFDLMYGSIAMVDLAEGTVVKFRQDDQAIATLRWKNKATAMVQRSASGLQIQVDGGEIEINNTPVREESVQVANHQVQTVRAPKRLPRWITRPDDSTAAERLILTQIADTDDLTASLHQKIGALASSPTLRRDDARLLAKLANWQAALAGTGLFRLAGNRVPAVRLAALQRLVQLSESDPRYERVWNAVDRSVNNPQRTAQMRVWFRLIRSGARPNAAQLEQMLNGLSTRDFAGRALSDFMLRQYVPNPPPFDPTWTGQKLQRAVSAYRERTGLPVDRLRPNAAAPGAR